MLSHYAMMYMEVFPLQYDFPDTFLGREQLHGLTVASIAISNYRASNFSGSSKEASEKFNFDENKANIFQTTQTKRVGELEDEKRYWNVTFRRSKSQVLAKCAHRMVFNKTFPSCRSFYPNELAIAGRRICRTRRKLSP